MAHNFLGGPTGQPFFCSGLLSSLCVAILLLTLAGCSVYEPKIRTAAKGAPAARSPKDILEELLKKMDDLEKVTRSVTNAKTAGTATPALNAAVEPLKSLAAEYVSVRRNVSAEEGLQIEGQYEGRMNQGQATLFSVLADLAKMPGLPGEFTQSVALVKNQLTQTLHDVTTAKDLPAAPQSDVLPNSPPDSSGWVVWLLCLLILAVCAGFLCRDGLWSNAICLVNVVFAGLLAMNFYEPLANRLTNFSDDLHTYVTFFDFLSLWICFVFFASVFRAATDAVSRVRVRFLKIVDLWGGIVMSLCTGWVMVGFTLTTLHAAPLGQYPLLGSFQPQNSMFFGMLAPDREWLGFTKYQSKEPFCRSVEQDCSFPPNFIEAQLTRRMHIEKYVLGNVEHAVRINPQFMKAKPKQ
ncbi:MAG: CvpA family protein [Thermoguttaceae bacterium]